MRAFLLLPVLALAAGCTVLDPHNMIGRQFGDAAGIPTEPVAGPPAGFLDAAARGRAFDFVWDTINGRYHDASFNGVDWTAVGIRYRPLALAARDDEAFWETLDHMTGELKDAHTRVDSPAQVELRRRDESVTLGFAFVPLDGRLAVTGVHPDSDAWWAGVRAGMTIATIAGEPALHAYDLLISDTRLDSTDRSRHLRAMRRLMTGSEGSSVEMTFDRGDGTRFTATLTRGRLSTRPGASHRVLPSGFGYLRLTQWTVGLTGRTLQGLESLMDTPGIVIDLRGNPGGSVHAVNALLAHFFTKRTDLGRVTTRTGLPVALLFGTVEIIRLKSEIVGRPDAYAGPLVILVNAGSASGSELFAGAMQAAGRAVVVGEPSCGCLLGFLGYARVPGGGELAYSEVGFVLANGKRIEGEGVIPDHLVSRSLADLRESRDRALETAQDLLRAGLKEPTKNGS